MQNIRAILLADSADCLIKVCGVSSLERLLRTLQRLGFDLATVVTTNAQIAAAAKARSWASADIQVEVMQDPPATEGKTLIVPANVYCDPRLMRALCQTENSTRIPDGPRLVVPGSEMTDRLEPRDIDPYVPSMRRRVPPICRPVTPANVRETGRLLLASAQKGTLDIPAYVHAPIERLLACALARTPVTPNQITSLTALLAAAATIQFAFGRLASATVIALIVGVLDGVDGKLARIKMETTELGKWEHKIDAAVEASWWLAMGWHFRATGEVSNAMVWPVALLGAHVLGDIARRYVEAVSGRSMDDRTAGDRAFRLIGGRRNVYIWMFAIALLLGKPAAGFVGLCLWGIFTCTVHVARAIVIWNNRRMEVAASQRLPV